MHKAIPRAGILAHLQNPVFIASLRGFTHTEKKVITMSSVKHHDLFTKALRSL
jgi:hypothetical protein